MWRTIIKYSLAGVFITAVSVVSASAQMFGDESPAPAASAPASPSRGWSNRDILNGSGKQGTSPQAFQRNNAQAETVQPAKAATTATKPPAKVEVENPEEWQYKYTPQLKRPTLDGVKRGTTAVYPISLDGSPKEKDDRLIFLYYSDFSVKRLLSGTITCNVRFQIMSTLDRKLNNLSVRLRWPNMETVLTFIDVVPNQLTHFDYALLGEGCYSMDKIPNIVVNRCRVKGLSQKECAAKIRWLRK